MPGQAFPLRTQNALCPGLATDIYLQPSSEEAVGDTGWCFQGHQHLLLNYEHTGGQEHFEGWVQGPHGDHQILQKGKRSENHNSKLREPSKEKLFIQKQRTTSNLRHGSRADSWLGFRALWEGGSTLNPARASAGWINSPSAVSAWPPTEETSQMGLISPCTASSTHYTSMERADSGLSMIFLS